MASLPPILRDNRVFRVFLIASSTSLLGSSVFDLAIPLYVLQKTHSEFWLALAAASLQLPYVALAPLTGYLVDRFNKRALMIGSDLLQVVLLGVLAVVVNLRPDPVWPLLLLTFAIKSLMIVFETIANFQLVPCLVEKKCLSNANAWFLSSQRAIQVAGPLIGGTLMETTGLTGCILFNALTFTATLFFSVRTRAINDLVEKRLGTNRADGSFWKGLSQNFSESLRAIGRSSLLRPFVLLMFFWNLSSLVPNAPAVTYLLTEKHHLSPIAYGFAISLIGVSGVMGYFLSPLFQRATFLSRILMRSAFWQAVLGTLCVAFTDYPILFIAFFALYRLPGSTLTAATFLLRQTRVPPHQMGSINSSLRMLFMVGAPTSCLVQGQLIHNYGVGPALCFGALCLWSTALFSREVASAYNAGDKLRALEVDRAA